MKVIGVGGQLGSGKDTLADYLAERLEAKTPDLWKRTGFAHAVKKVYMETFDKTWSFVEEWKRKDEIPPGMDLNVRKSLQFIGDGFRQIKNDIWIDTAFREDVPKIISDVRYINEARHIRDHGGLNILCWRPGWENNDPNASEAQIRPVVDWFRDMGIEGFCSGTPPRSAAEGVGYFDIFIRNNGSLQELYQKVDQYVVPIIFDKFYSS
jgi:hypothetical protein